MVPYPFILPAKTLAVLPLPELTDPGMAKPKEDSGLEASLGPSCGSQAARKSPADRSLRSRGCGWQSPLPGNPDSLGMCQAHSSAADMSGISYPSFPGFILLDPETTEMVGF